LVGGPTAADVALNHRRFNGGGLRSWHAMQAETGGAIDLGTLEHREVVHRWLNRWGCRLPYDRDGNETTTVTSLEHWWQAHRTHLAPIVGVQLADITDDQIEISAEAFVELSRSRASVRRTIGPTAASKVMMGLSPRTFPAWDATIARTRYGGAGLNAYRDHLAITRGWALDLGEGVSEIVDDAAGITVAKLLDEWLYEHHTRSQAGGVETSARRRDAAARIEAADNDVVVELAHRGDRSYG
jgi:hypothetical protein